MAEEGRSSHSRGSGNRSNRGGDHSKGFQRSNSKRGGFKGPGSQERRYSKNNRGNRFYKQDNRRKESGEDQRPDRRSRDGFHEDSRRGFRNDNERRSDYRSGAKYHSNNQTNRRGGQSRGQDERRWDTRSNSRDERNGNHRSHAGSSKNYSSRDSNTRGQWHGRNDHDKRSGGQGFKPNNHYQDGPRRNSDGTISYPSQNPYTDPRPGEPSMPKGLEWSMLSKDDKERLRGLSKEHAENIGLHILAAYALEESDPDRALAHAKWVARQASRVDIARETLALVAYRQGDYKLALREFRTAFRMNGYLDYLPFIADCERGLNNPRKAIEEATSYEAQGLRGESKAEMFLVYAGALADLGLLDQAIQTVHQLSGAKGLSGDYRMRAVQAEQNFLEQAGRSEQSLALNPLLDRLEAEYADDDDISEAEIIIDNDLEHANEAMLENLNIAVEANSYGLKDNTESLQQQTDISAKNGDNSAHEKTTDEQVEHAPTNNSEEKKTESAAESETASPEQSHNENQEAGTIE